MLPKEKDEASPEVFRYLKPNCSVRDKNSLKFKPTPCT